jgi:hypothetical protein
MEASDSESEKSEESDEGYEPSDVEVVSESEDDDSDEESVVESEEEEVIFLLPSKVKKLRCVFFAQALACHKVIDDILVGNIFVFFHSRNCAWRFQ